MFNKTLAARFTKIILEAQNTDEEGLTALRKKIIKAVGTFGAKRFVTVTAQVLKDNFRIEGCNDVRIPLKRIFNISLDELENVLDKKKYKLPAGHPIDLLSRDHKDNIQKLKRLKINLNQSSDNILVQDIKDYFKEMDTHIKKEEDVFFPILEEKGMDEHPDNLKEEHKSFREILKTAIAIIENESDSSKSKEKIKPLMNKFIPDICNHIFRETYIFYPAALEFIREKKEWKAIESGFEKCESPKG